MSKRIGLDATLTGPKRKVKWLKAYYQQGGRWYRVGGKRKPLTKQERSGKLIVTGKEATQ